MALKLNYVGQNSIKNYLIFCDDHFKVKNLKGSFKDEIIDSINYNITPDIFSCSYKLSNADVQAFMRLDNALFGILDTDKLGY